MIPYQTQDPKVNSLHYQARQVGVILETGVQWETKYQARQVGVIADTLTQREPTSDPRVDMPIPQAQRVVELSARSVLERMSEEVGITLIRGDISRISRLQQTGFHPDLRWYEP